MGPHVSGSHCTCSDCTLHGNFVPSGGIHAVCRAGVRARARLPVSDRQTERRVAWHVRPDRELFLKKKKKDREIFGQGTGAGIARIIPAAAIYFAMIFREQGNFCEISEL